MLFARHGVLALYCIKRKGRLAYQEAHRLLAIQKRAGLAAPKRGILSAGRRKLGVRAVFYDLAVRKNHDAVECGDGRQAVRYHNRGTSLHKILKGVLHQRLAFGVERAGRLVQHQDGGVREDGARDRYALALPAGQLDAAFSHQGIQPCGQAVDEFERVGELRCTANLRMDM